MTSVIDNTRKSRRVHLFLPSDGDQKCFPRISMREKDAFGNKDGIRYGMYAIKSIGRQVIDIILAEREANGKYITLSDS